MTYTYATVIVPAGDQAAAQSDLGDGFFVSALSADGKTATHYMSSGPFNNDELELVVNTVQWTRKIYFGNEWERAVEAEGLVLLTNPQP